MTCHKVTWTSKKEARRAASRYLATEGGHGMEAYYHAECDRWHLGHNSKVRPIPCRKCRAPILIGPASWGGYGPVDPATGRDHKHQTVAA